MYFLTCKKFNFIQYVIVLVSFSALICLCSQLPAHSVNNVEHWPSGLAQREHSFNKIGAAIAREPGFPLNGTDAQKGQYLFSRWPDVVEHYGLTAGTGSRPSDITVGTLRLFDGVDVDGNASLKSALGRGNCAEFTYAFQDVLKGAGVESHAMFADNDANQGISDDFTGTDTALYIEDKRSDGTVVRRVFDAFRLTYEHQQMGESYADAVKQFGDAPMTDADVLPRDAKGRGTWLGDMTKKFVKDALTQSVLPPNMKSKSLTSAQALGWRAVLGRWSTPSGTEILIRGENGKLEGLYVKVSAKGRVQGLPDNGYVFLNGTAKAGPPVTLESNSAYIYKQKCDCPSLAPFNKCQMQIAFNTIKGTATFKKKAPLYSLTKCRWALGSPWDIETFTAKKVEE
jgi:hypothetical protein